MLIIGLILFWMLVGAGRNCSLGNVAKGSDWTLAIVAAYSVPSSMACRAASWPVTAWRYRADRRITE